MTKIPLIVAPNGKAYWEAEAAIAYVGKQGQKPETLVWSSLVHTFDGVKYFSEIGYYQLLVRAKFPETEEICSVIMPRIMRDGSYHERC